MSESAADIDVRCCRIQLIILILLIILITPYDMGDPQPSNRNCESIKIMIMSKIKKVG